MKEENKVQSIRIVKVFNGFVIVGPKSYIAADEESAEESVRSAFKDVLKEFDKSTEETTNAIRPNSITSTEAVDSTEIT